MTDSRRIRTARLDACRRATSAKREAIDCSTASGGNGSNGLVGMTRRREPVPSPISDPVEPSRPPRRYSGKPNMRNMSTRPGDGRPTMANHLAKIVPMSPER